MSVLCAMRCESSEALAKAPSRLESQLSSISPDSSLDGAFASASELSQRIAQSTLTRDCLATQWYRYAMGRIEDANDRCSLDGVKSRFSSANGQFRELFVAIVLSEGFRYRAAEEVAP